MYKELHQYTISMAHFGTPILPATLTEHPILRAQWDRMGRDVIQWDRMDSFTYSTQ